MKRYLKHIFLALTATLMAVSCLEELEIETPTFGDEVVTLVPRVQSFANRYVTKAEYADNETIISKYTVLVFNNAGNLVHKQSVTGDDPFKLNKSMLNSSANGDLTEATVVMLANMDYEDVNNAGATVTKLSDFETCTYKPAQAVITSISDGFTGFPMIGGIKMVNLSSTKDQQPPLAVELKILYAKIHFEIAVAEGGENDNVATNGMQFVLSGCTVYNSATATSIAIPAVKDKPAVDFLGDPVSEEPAEVDGATSSSNYSGSTAISLGKTGTAKLNDDKINFTFYVLESRYNHGSDLRGIYPDDSWLTSKPAEDVKNYKGTADDAKCNGVKYFYDDRIQQYKPKLAGTGKATYVRLNGTYTDYRGVAWKVEYDLYLGKDNALNFHVDRNSEYTNYISIKGIRNNDDYYDKDENGNKVDQHIWIDHRVNVSYNGSGVDDHVTITRETLLDAHIEVRPLRVKWDNNEFDGVRIYLPTKSDGSLVDWIGIERFTGNNNADGSTYCLIDDEANPGKKKSSGKRKYFTTDLIDELQNKEGEFGVKLDDGKKYIYLLNNECAWIYFDENLSNEDRTAEIKLEFYTKSGDTQEVVYKVKQRCLQTVGGYAIESYEEYLHSYDSADKYDLSTSPVDYTQQGLKWGFMDHKLSQSTIVNATDVPSSTLKEQIIKNYSYDYFHSSDGPTYKLFTKTSGSWASASFGTGLDFTDRASANRDIAVKDMGTKPENAYQYCLSKNKFTTDGLGNVSMKINWYLPDVYEMQSILAASQSGNSTADFDSDAFYWSSQPSFERLLDMDILGYELSLINEMPDKARAVSAQGISDLPRKNQNRIRCVYAKNGISLDEEDMEDRVPDGIDGNFSVYMKAWDNGSAGYFKYLLPAAETKPTSSTTEINDSFGYDANTDSYTYPTDSNSSTSTEFKYRTYQQNDYTWIGGFEKDPANKNNWDETALNYYSTLNTYPGLSKFVTTKGLTSARKEETTRKSKVLTVTDVSTIVDEKTLSESSTLRTLDHLTGGTMLNLSFGQSTGSKNPTFIYDEKVKESKTVTTDYWESPVYSLQTFTLLPNKATETGTDSGSSNNWNTVRNKDDARKDAFDRAYDEAKDNALKRLNSNLDTRNASDPGWVISGLVTYTELYWNTIPENSYSNERKVLGFWSSTCTVTVTATANIVKSASVSLYNISSEGHWQRDSEKTTHASGVINNDELRMYCGNSFTISLSEAAKAEGYEITKVKVHYSGNNFVDNFGTLNEDKAYARFVDNEINLSDYELADQFVIGSTEVLQLPGMDFSADGETGWHQWAGEGRNSITLLLADYNVNYNLTSISYTYNYDSTPLDSEKFIIVDQIEVKCSKKKKAEFDFAKIYTEGGNMETSYCTVKHITFTGEAASDEAPVPGATADGLKLYSGSKVTFKALDGYVINSISGDESLTFKGSQQTVEFTGLPEKTITAPIVVLYSKAATETN